MTEKRCERRKLCCAQDTALTLVRMTLGYTFMLHGAQKLFGLFGGTGLQEFTSWLGTLGVGPLWAKLAAIAEFAGGVLLLTGIASEVGAVLTIPVMLGAVLFVHWSKGFFVQNGGYEYPLNLVLFALAVIVGGPGKWALWNPFTSWRNRYYRD